ncbi:SET domain-containing protein 5 [Diaporthe amygdali]|uniref:SET domain-containing protein 5 n=1 Tax=Phomopsis amygdali TaxID=1214568 RepID=UPI0022FDCD46|nr:SET domain-containing protein 5 [Diaporthe amygdali]KAJ0107043.1 SET domain-containing protein 5 [Diaporthe amygdali]
MGIDAGFDMVPRLSRDVADKLVWSRFIDLIKMCYFEDDQLEIKSNYILFKAGEHPMLPLEGHKFLRFSAKISGQIAIESRVEAYIKGVARLAKDRFGSRIQFWSEAFDEWGYYDWNEVNESLRSYEKPDGSEIPMSIADCPVGDDPERERNLPLFEVKDIPGKGKGLFARIEISKGTRILYEKPLLTVESMSPLVSEPILARKFKTMAKIEQRQILSLHNNFPGKYTLTSIFKTNALPCGPGSSTSGVYASICLINHSCLPNSHHNWNDNEKHETIHAIRPIKAGEEITIQYDHGGPSKVRRAFLRKNYGFECDCKTCTLPPAELQASDDRRVLFRQLDSAICDLFRQRTKPAQSLRDCHTLLQAVDKEFDGHGDARSCSLYYDAFQICIAHGDQARASRFAEKAYKARVCCDGEDSSATRWVKWLSLKPTDHMSYGLYSTKWITEKSMVPKDLNEAQFVAWLFREE